MPRIPFPQVFFIFYYPVFFFLLPPPPSPIPGFAVVMKAIVKNFSFWYSSKNCRLQIFWTNRLLLKNKKEKSCVVDVFTVCVSCVVSYMRDGAQPMVGRNQYNEGTPIPAIVESKATRTRKTIVPTESYHM